MSCPKIEEIVMFLDGALSDFLSKKVLRHLRSCERCKQLIEGIRKAMYEDEEENSKSIEKDDLIH